MAHRHPKTNAEKHSDFSFCLMSALKLHLVSNSAEGMCWSISMPFRLQSLMGRTPMGKWRYACKMMVVVEYTVKGVEAT
eukprot:scaffold34778_cov16-Tisochrysis_lutea.AAC.1